MTETEKKALSARGRKRIQRLLLASLLLLVVIVALPRVVAWQGERWLAQQGVSDARIGDVDINLFTGEVAVSGVVVGRGEGQTLRLDSAYVNVAYLPLFQKRIEIQAVRLQGLDMDLDIRDPAQMRVGALLIASQDETAVEPEPEASASEWQFGVDSVDIRDVAVRAHTPQHDGLFVVEALRLGALATWQAQRPSPLALHMEIDGARLDVTTAVAPFKAEPDWQGEIRVEGVDFSRYARLLEPVGLSNIAGKVNLNANLSGQWRGDESVALKFDSDLTVAGLGVEHPEAQLSLDEIEWQGQGALHYPPRADETLLEVESELALRGMQLVTADEKRVTQQSLHWQGAIHYSEDRAEAGDGVRVKGALNLEGLGIDDEQARLALLRLDSLKLDGIDVAGLNQIGIEAVSLAQLVALKEVERGEADPFVSIGEVSLGPVEVRQQQFAEIGKIDIAALHLALLLDEQGRVQGLDRLGSGNEAGADVASVPTDEASGAESVTGEEAEAGQAFTFRLDRIKVGGDSWIAFEDRSVKPLYQVRMSPFSLLLENLDSSQPEQPARLDLKTQLAKYTHFKLKGSLWPFQEKISADLKGALTGLDLPSLSPYAVTYMGYDLRRGRLDDKLDIKIDQGVLNINNGLTISKLNIIEADTEKARNFSESLAMPLDVALGLLKDGDDNIKFDMPIKGDMSAPEFSMSGVVNLALAQGMKMAAMKYALGALQPLGTIVFVGKLLGKAAEMRFQPLLFDAGQSELNEKGREYADKIANLMIERPGLTLTFCGVASGADEALARQALLDKQPAPAAQTEEAGQAEPVVDPQQLKTRLLDLAQARGDVLKDFFVNSKGIDAQRLFACRPSVDLAAESVPRVEITL